MTKSISIAFQANGEGSLTCAGLGTFACLGQPGRQYPPDLMVFPETDKFPEHESQEFPGVIMKWCILIWGQKGIYIHEGPDNLQENGGPSAGCIHLGVGNAKRVYDWFDQQTRVTTSYPWPMGDLEVEVWGLLKRLEKAEREPHQREGQSRTVEQIVNAARDFADHGKVFAGGCSDMVRTAYAAGQVKIPGGYTASDILDNYPCIVSPQPGDVAGWKKSPNDHVVIYLGPNSYANCPGPNQATKYNVSMGQPLTYVRPT